MRNIIILLVIIFGLFLISGCIKERPKDVAIRVNDFITTIDEFEDEFKNSGYSKDKEGKENFLEDLIDRKLLLQEAERLGLDKEKEFLKEIEHFWERTLLKNIFDKKSKELAGKVHVYEDEIQAHYDEMIKNGLTKKSYEEIYDQIKWQILREKQTKAFDDWLKDLRKKAKIEANRELLRIK